MNKKLILISIFVVFMLLAISIVSAVNAINIDAAEKESPLYRFRAEKYTTQQKLREFRNTLLSGFLRQHRIFFMQDLSVYGLSISHNSVELGSTPTGIPTGYSCTCAPHGCGPTGGIFCK